MHIFRPILGITLLVLTLSFSSEIAAKNLKDKAYFIQHEGRERAYIVHLPENYSEEKIIRW
jgi:hypothetical protein